MNARHSQHGATLIEALVSLLILSVSLMAATKLQAWLRVNGDVARERSEAVRLAQRDAERLRALAFGSVQSGHDETASATTRFALQREVHDNEDTKALTTRVTWQHRGGSEQHVQLATAIARLNPIYSAALALPAQDHVLALQRQLPGIARSLIDGRTLLRPTSTSRVAWVINNATGEITHQCPLAAAGTDAENARNLAAVDLSACEPFEARLLRGHVRFALSSTPDPLNANDVPLSLALQVADVRCETESLTLGTERHLAYACAVPSAQSMEPTFIPQGWTLGTTATSFRACRYPSAARAPRNYLVVRGDIACPSALPPHNGTPVVTVQHQP